MENIFIIDTDQLSASARRKKQQLENDPSSRRNHMEYMADMEVIESDVCECVISQMNEYDYERYTAEDVRAA